MERTISASVGKGSLNHNNRTFVAQNVDKGRIQNNVCYVRRNLKQVYHEIFDEALAAYNAKQKRKDRMIPDYYEKIKHGNQEKLFYEIILQIGNKDDMSALSTEEAELSKQIFAEYMEHFQERNPNLIVFNAVLHMDEATPHVHIDYVPVMFHSKRGLGVRNSMKGALAEQGFKGEGRKSTEWAKWAESEKKALANIMEKYEIHWKQLGTHEEHLSVLDYKKKMRTREVQELENVITEKEERLQEQQQQMKDSEEVIWKQIQQIVHKQELITGKEKEYQSKSEKVAQLENAIADEEHELSALRQENRKCKDELTTMEEEQWKLRCDLRNANLDVKEKQMELWKVEQEITDKKANMETELATMESKMEELEEKKKVLEEELEQKQLVKEIADMEFEQRIKSSEERLDGLQKKVIIAKQVYDEYARLPLSDRHYQSMEDILELKQKVMELEQENREIRSLLQKAYDFMKGFVINGMTLLDKFLATVGERIKSVFEDRNR